MICLLFMTENRPFRTFIIITMILIPPHDSGCRPLSKSNELIQLFACRFRNRHLPCDRSAGIARHGDREVLVGKRSGALVMARDIERLVRRRSLTAVPPCSR